MNRHQNSERHHTTNKTNSFHFEDAYVNLAYENNSDSPDDTQQNSDDPQMNKIQEMGSVLTNNGKHKIHCLTIIGQIEGHYVLPSQNKTTKYEHIIPQLVAIEEEPEIEGLLILLNTVGGDVEAGLALAELFAGMKKPTVSLVLGGGHSIGVPLAVAAQKSFIAPSATVTIHPVRMNGLTLGVPQTFEYFQKMQQRITTFVSKHSKMNPERFYQLAMNTEELVMDVGTVLDGPDAVKEGLIDGLGSLSDALECLYEMIDNNKKDHGHAEHTEGQPSVEEYSSVVGQPSVEEKAAMKSNHADTKKKTKKRTTKK